MAAPVKLRNASDSFVSEKYPDKNYNTMKRLYLADGAAADTRYAYIYFGVPSGMADKQILSATLRLYSGTASQWTGSVTVSLYRLAAKYSASRVTWNNKPATTGGAISLTKTNPATNEVWEFDVTSAMQSVANGAAWYGFRISATNSTTKWIHSAQADDKYRPMLEIKWSNAPEAPEVLIPSNSQAVSVAKPTLQWDFTDVLGDTNMENFHLRLFSTLTLANANGTGDVLDTIMASTEPQVDLDDTTYGGLAGGATLHWRVRVQDGSGLWSLWSPVASFTRINKGTLTVTNPTGTGRTLQTNLVRNPSVEVDTTNLVNHTATGVATVARSTLQAYVGTASAMREVTATPSGDPGVTFTLDAARSTGALSWGVWVYFTVAANARAYGYGTVTSTGAIGAIFGTVIAVPANTWTRLTHSVASLSAVDRTITSVGYTVTATGAAVGTRYFVDAAIAVADATLPTYFSGDTVDTYENQYDWTGTANASTSVHRGRPYVNDPTPPIMWTFTGQTQRAYEVLLSTPETPAKYIWRSGRITSTATAVTIPKKKITQIGKTYRLKVRIFDTIDRRAVPDDPIYVEVSRDFQFDYSTTVSTVTGLAASPDAYRPQMLLTWSRATAPDYFVILRNGKVIDEVEPTEVFTSGTSYSYIDDEARPRRSHTWSVASKVNGVMSTSNPTVTGTVKLVTTTLSTLKDVYEIFLFNPDVAAAKTEASEVHYILGNAAPILITQSARGYEGTVTGVIADDQVPGLTTDAQLDALQYFKENPGKTLKLVWVDKSLRVVVYNVTDTPLPYPNGKIDYLVSFDFFQVDLDV